MGWKTDLIIIDRELEDKTALLKSLGRSNYSLQGQTVCEDMFPPQTLMIASYGGCTIIADPKLPSVILDGPDGPDARRLCTEFHQDRVLCCVLHSVVNLSAFALYERGDLVRSFGVSAADGVMLDSGAPLEAERGVLGDYDRRITEDGETVYVEGEGEAFPLDALGEDIVFEVISSLLGERPDTGDWLFENPADVYTKRSLLKTLFSR